MAEGAAMSSPYSYLQRLVVPFLFLVLILVTVAGCSDDDPVRPLAKSDISGVVMTPDGGPAPDATVYLGRDPEFMPMAATFVFDSVLANDAGHYEFNELDTGTYRVYAGVWGNVGEGFSLVSSFSGPRDITSKSAGHVVNLSLQEMTNDGVVAGEVFYNWSPGPIPVDSTTVSLYLYQGSETVKVDETATNADGRFALVGVETGNYVVIAVKILEPEAPFPLFLSAESEAFFCDGNDLARVERLLLEDTYVEKPAVYLYPEQPGRFHVALEFGPGVRLTASEPEYGTGWDVFVDEAGRIDETWDYLFYEIAMRGAPMIPEGWCLSWSGLSAGLESITVALGLNAAEKEDFLGYWMSRLPRRDYYEIYPVIGSDLDAWVELDITPAPDSALRFWMFFRGQDAASGLTAPRIPDFERTGTTVVEWGGAVIP